MRNGTTARRITIDLVCELESIETIIGNVFLADIQIAREFSDSLRVISCSRCFQLDLQLIALHEIPSCEVSGFLSCIRHSCLSLLT
jgi:hypothetical protein